MRKDDVIAPMAPHQIVRFIDWLEWQTDRHYEQRLEVQRKGNLDVAYHLKLEAHTYERVLHAFLQVMDGQSPGEVPSRL